MIVDRNKHTRSVGRSYFYEESRKEVADGVIFETVHPGASGNRVQDEKLVGRPCGCQRADFFYSVQIYAEI